MGTIATCVRPQGESIVDLSFATPSIHNKIKYWMVNVIDETLSDHRYIEYQIEMKESSEYQRKREHYKRRKWKNMDDELLREAVEWSLRDSSNLDVEDPDKFQAWLEEATVEACNLSTPRARGGPGVKHTYWWNEEIRRMRNDCNKARRVVTRLRKRQHQGIRVQTSEEENYRQKKRALRREISAAKARAWQELMDSINDNPWGLPYKLVMGKLRRGGKGLSETLSQEELIGLLLSLFPRNNNHTEIMDTPGRTGKTSNHPP